MPIETRLISYRHRETALEGLLTYDPAWRGARPAVLVLHGIEGRSQDQDECARKLADWGYAGFSADMFGKNLTSTGIEELQQLMTEFLADRVLLQDRLLHIVDTVKSLPEVDSARVAAVGFCFGGLCALDLARAGADVRAIASFHGLLKPPPEASDAPIASKVLVFHGWDDPYAPPEDVTALGRELTARKADWQIHAFGNAMHAFMAPQANNPESGVQYNPVAARRAWASLQPFLAEALD